MEQKAKDALKTAEQMLKYRERELNNPDKNEWAVKRMTAEIEALELLVEYAKEALSARGIHA